jgi:glutamine cyclotransferase
MKNLNGFYFIFLALFLTNCTDTKKYFSIDQSKLKAQYTLENSLKISILNPDNKEIDSVTYLINDKKIGSSKKSTDFTFNFANSKLGYQNLVTTIYSDGEIEKDSVRIELVSNISPKLLSFKIVNSFPHDIEAYTQGLEFYQDTLYEGTGNGAGNGTGKKGISSLRKTDYKTGKVLKKLELESNYFGEGITILNNKIYQLTWQNNEGYIYDVKTFKKIKTFSYFKNMEGWGLTNDGENLYTSDGSEKIYILNPETLKEIDYFNVYSTTNKVKEINELEWVNGKIFANIYQNSAIAVINPKTGVVEAIVNFGELEKQITKLPDTDVLNGIAYNPKTKTFFVTGKNWNKMFEIKIEGY